MTKNLSTIRRKAVLSIIAVVFAALCLCGLVACTHEGTTEEDLRERGYSIKVTYDYQGGAVNEQPKTEILIKPGSKVPDPSDSKIQMDNPVRANYSFKYFAEAAKDENGEYKKDDNGNYIAGERWDFKTVPTHDTVLLAQWWENYRIILHYGENDELTQTSQSIYRNADGSPQRIPGSAYIASGYTFLDYYTNDAKTELIEVPLVSPKSELFENSQDGLTLHLYSDTLKGEYVVLREVRDISKISAGSNVYVYKDIDANGSKTVSFPIGFSGEIIGNGHTISNFVVDITEPMNSTATAFGLFRSISSTAKIKNLTFDNVSYSVSCSNIRNKEMVVGLFASTVEKGAEITDVHVTNSTLRYQIPSGFTDLDHVYVSEFIARNSAEDTTTNSGASNITVYRAGLAYTADNEYIAYVNYTDEGGNLVIDGVYALAQAERDAENNIVSYRSHTMPKTKIVEQDGKYVIEISKTVYTIAVSANGDDLSAVVEVTQKQ